MNTIRASHFLHLPELRKQAKRRAGSLTQLGIQVFHQREASALQRLRGVIGALLRVCHPALHRAFHPTHHRCRH
jgi:hypothetical protein